MVGALCYLYLAVVGRGLTFLVKAHDNDGGTVAHDVAGMAEELVLTVLQGYGVDNAFALYTFQSGCDDIPLR